MASQNETWLAEIMQQMLTMQAASEERARQREDRDKQERREWEQSMREEGHKREERLLTVLKDSQPAVPQTMHI